MVRQCFLALGAFALLGLLSSPVPAATCAVDDVPAATLLLPYFEVDLANPGGRTTLFSVANADAAPRLALVVLWTDLGVPSHSFHIYLTGYDVETVNLRDVFTTGAVPQTGPGVSPTGDFSLPDVTFPGCDDILPSGNLPQVLRHHIRNFHTGTASPVFEGKCGGVDRGSDVARGYVTIDLVDRCDLLLPNEEGYFGDDGVLAYDNVLFGEFYLLDPAEDSAQGNSLVRLEADQERFTEGSRTFYGRLSGDGSDAREPLPAVWSTRYMDGGAFDGGTEVIVWRDATLPSDPFSCDVVPIGFPVQEGQMVAFDEDENGWELELNYACVPIISDFVAFPWVTNLVEVGGPSFPVVTPFGWLFLNLQVPGQHDDYEVDPHSQAWVGSLTHASGRFSVGLNGTPVSDACSNELEILLQP